MTKLTLTTSLGIAILLLSSPARMQASGDTPIIIKDGSILLRPDGLDAGKIWNPISKSELRHVNTQGVLTSLKIADGGADQCGGNPTCGIDTTKSWTIRLVYNRRSVTISSLSGNKGVRIKFSKKISFDQWTITGNADEREFGHLEGLHISSIKVNKGATSLCSGKGNCEVTLIYTYPTP